MPIGRGFNDERRQDMILSLSFEYAEQVFAGTKTYLYLRAPFVHPKWVNWCYLYIPKPTRLIVDKCEVVRLVKMPKDSLWELERNIQKNKETRSRTWSDHTARVREKNPDCYVDAAINTGNRVFFASCFDTIFTARRHTNTSSVGCFPHWL